MASITGDAATVDPLAADIPVDGGELRVVSEQAAFDGFFAATVRRTTALAFGLTGNWSDADELTQDAYADAHRRWATVGSYDDPAAWVRRAVLNRSASRWRRVRREVRALTRLGSRPPIDTADVADLDPQFWRCVNDLPIRQRQVVAMAYIEDLGVAEIADRLGCSEGTVKSHLSRARQSLRRTLTDPKEDLS